MLSLRTLPAGLAAAVVLLVSPACQRNSQTAAKKEDGPVTVRVAKVSQRTILRAIESVGTLFPYDEAVISAEIDGPLVEVHADLGDLSERGPGAGPHFR